MVRGKSKGVKKTVRCYLCGHRFEVSTKTMSTACPGCYTAIKVEDLVIKSYLPVNDLQTCGKITITKRGRVAAKRIQCGDGIVCEGAMEGNVETDGEVELGPKATWRGKELYSRAIHIADGAKVEGHINVPWSRSGELDEPEETAPAKKKTRRKTVRKKATTTGKKTTSRTRPARS